MLSAGTPGQRREFLRSFVKRVETADKTVTIEYALPLPPDKTGIGQEGLPPTTLYGGAIRDMGETGYSAFRMKASSREYPLARMPEGTFLGHSTSTSREVVMKVLLGLGIVLALVAGLGVWGVWALTNNGVSVLMKAEGWRDELGQPAGSPFAIVEIAFDRETAERAWADNTPEGLAPRTGAPEEPGIYGDLDRVDFDTQAVVVWSSGESSSCPGWLADMNVKELGTVEIQRDDTAGFFGACTDDYNAYRMLVAVDQDRLPAPDELPTEDVAGIPSGLVTTYPAKR